MWGANPVSPEEMMPFCSGSKSRNPLTSLFTSAMRVIGRAPLFIRCTTQQLLRGICKLFARFSNKPSPLRGTLSLSLYFPLSPLSVARTEWFHMGKPRAPHTHTHTGPAVGMKYAVRMYHHIIKPKGKSLRWIRSCLPARL